jgi:hypothetical protein
MNPSEENSKQLTKIKDELVEATAEVKVAENLKNKADSDLDKYMLDFTRRQIVQSLELGRNM